MAVEQLHVIDWIVATLSGDATIAADAPGGVWRDEAPASVTPPYVVINHQGGHDVLGVNSWRAFVDDTYQVGVWGPTKGTATLYAIADRIDALLQRASGTSGGVTILHSRREQVLVTSENVAGEEWSTVRLICRVWAQ